MKRRVFVALNLSEDIKSAIAKVLEPLEARLELDMRFLKAENWHVTLSFLGYQDDDAIARIVHAVEQVAHATLPPAIQFEKVVYGPYDPSGRTTPARMVWLLGKKESSRTLGMLEQKLEETLVTNGVRVVREGRKFELHLTLARAKGGGTRPPIPLDLPCEIRFVPETLDVMESILKRSGAEYLPLSCFDFK